MTSSSKAPMMKQQRRRRNKLWCIDSRVKYLPTEMLEKLSLPMFPNQSKILFFQTYCPTNSKCNLLATKPISWCKMLDRQKLDICLAKVRILWKVNSQCQNNHQPCEHPSKIESLIPQTMMRNNSVICNIEASRDSKLGRSGPERPSWLGFWLHRSELERKCGVKSASQWNGRSAVTGTGNRRVDRAKKRQYWRKDGRFFRFEVEDKHRHRADENTKSVLVVALSLPKQTERVRKRQCPWHEWGRVSARDVSPWIREEDRKSDLQIHGQQA